MANFTFKKEDLIKYLKKVCSIWDDDTMFDGKDYMSWAFLPMAIHFAESITVTEEELFQLERLANEYKEKAEVEVKKARTSYYRRLARQIKGEFEAGKTYYFERKPNKENVKIAMELKIPKTITPATVKGWINGRVILEYPDFTIPAANFVVKARKHYLSITPSFEYLSQLKRYYNISDKPSEDLNSSRKFKCITDADYETVFPFTKPV